MSRSMYQNIQHIRKFISLYWRRSLSVGSAWLYVVFGEQDSCLLQYFGFGFHSQDHRMLQGGFWSPSYLIYIPCCRNEGSQTGRTKGKHFPPNLQTSRDFHTALTYIVSLNLITWLRIADRVVGKPSL